MEDGELVGLVLARRDPLGHGRILLPRPEQALEHRLSTLRLQRYRPTIAGVGDAAMTGACATLPAVESPSSPVPVATGRPDTDAGTTRERPRVVVVMPAYNAAKTLERTYADVPQTAVHKIILVDDVSRDETVDIARQLGLDVIVHRQNRGYGGNQKTCYDAALEAGAQVVVMLHPDYQYDATRIPALIEPILA